MKHLIRNYVQKPSQLLQLMVDGLNKQSARPDFAIQMDTFGTSRGSMCYGCAATCALQELAKVSFTTDDINSTEERAEATGFTWFEVDKFELAVEMARVGRLDKMCENAALIIEGFPAHLPFPEKGWWLRNYNWREELPKVESYIELLKSQGL